MPVNRTNPKTPYYKNLQSVLAIAEENFNHSELWNASSEFS